ncbi:T9SS type A sorting domain-containing protein [bacterium]|nr:T9SS type A sorting domain-containing protein [bacterium]
MRNGLGWVIIFSAIISSSVTNAETLDWDIDRIACGLSSSEHHPLITSVNGILQLSCDTGDGWIITRFSANNGLTWGPIQQIKPAGFDTKTASCTDGQNTYLSVFVPSEDTLKLYRFDGEQQLADSHWIYFGAAYDEPSICMTSDYRFESDEPFLNIVWQEYYWSSGRIQGMFSQSRDQAQSFDDPEMVFEAMNDSPIFGNIVATVTWSGETEKTWVGGTVDRLGSIGEQVVLYSKIEGSGWQSVEIDSSAYTQVDLSIAGYEATLLAAYARRINAASQKEVFFAYSLNNGDEFTYPLQLTSGNTDEYDPKIVICPELNRFAIFYLSSEAQQEPATIWMIEGDLTAPWLISEAISVCENGHAFRTGGYDACATPAGFATVWAGLGLLEGTDIWFDASWQGESSQPIPAIPTETRLGVPYPNPFNSSVTIPLELSHGSDIEIFVHDILGREVLRKSFGSLSLGNHPLQLDFAGLPSGDYFIGVKGIPKQLVRVSYIK